MVDRLPEFQGPKYRGSFRRGDFADFHQRFSLVPRRCAGKYPPAAREIRADSWAPSIRVARTRKRLPRPPPPTEIGRLCCARPTPPRGDPLDFPIPPPKALVVVGMRASPATPPHGNRSSMLRSAYPPGGDALDSLIPPEPINDLRPPGLVKKPVKTRRERPRCRAAKRDHEFPAPEPAVQQTSLPMRSPFGLPQFSAAGS